MLVSGNSLLFSGIPNRQGKFSGQSIGSVVDISDVSSVGPSQQRSHRLLASFGSVWKVICSLMLLLTRMLRREVD